MQYRIIMNGHVVSMKHCDWPFTIEYINMLTNVEVVLTLFKPAYR